MRYRLPLCLLLVVLVICVFLQTGTHDFITFDDPLYVTENAHVKGGLTTQSVVWAFTSTAASNWHPLTWLSHLADVELFGLNPRGHHLVNVALHAAGAVLLFLLITEMTALPWQAFMVAALFALHPLHVESVAWVAERKDLLSGFFFFLTLLLYLRQARRPGWARTGATLLSFALGLMAKPMLVTLPLIMLLIDFWPLKRFPGQEGGGPREPGVVRLLTEKIPFFLLAALSCAVTIYAQKAGGAVQTLKRVPLPLRVENAVVSYLSYLIKTVLPLDLALPYPFPGAIPMWQVVGSALFILLVSLAVVALRRSRPYLLVGWGWYLVMLVPVIGIVQVGGQAMADRYSYLPLVGIFLIAVVGVTDLSGRIKGAASLLPAVGGLAIAAVAVLSWQQLQYWQNDLTLYGHTMQLIPGNYLVRNNYAIALAEAGRTDEAIALYDQVLRDEPDSAKDHVNLGVLLAQKGENVLAVQHYLQALRVKPEYPFALANLGRSLTDLGRDDEAIQRYREALRLSPELSGVHLDLALLLVKKNELKEAKEHYAEAVRIEPYSVRAPSQMGLALAQQHPEEALSYFREGLRINPSSAQCYFNMGVTLAKLGRTEEAAQAFRQVLAIKPDAMQARQWLERLGR